MSQYIELVRCLLKEIRLDARQRIHMKYEVLFSLKNNEKVFMNVFCCRRDLRFKVNGGKVSVVGH